MTAQWNDPSGCVGRYYVGIFNSQQTVVNNLGYHPAPATTSLSQNLGRSWDDIPNLDWFVKVRCHSSSSRMTIVGQASLQSGPARHPVEQSNQAHALVKTFSSPRADIAAPRGILIDLPTR